MRPALIVAALLASWSPPLAHAAPCDQEMPAVSLGADLTAAADAFGELDADTFRRSMAAVALQLPCLGDPAPPALVANLHRLRGVEAFLADDVDRMRGALRAARTLDPTLSLFDEVLPEGHALHTAWTEATPTPPKTTAVPGARDGQITFDGMPSTWRPTDRPTLMQVVGADDAVLLTAYLERDDPLPRYRRYTPLRTGLAIGAGASAGVALGLWGAGAATRPAALAATDEEALRAGAATTNGLTGTAIGVGIAAIAQAIAAATVGAR